MCFHHSLCTCLLIEKNNNKKLFTSIERIDVFYVHFGDFICIWGFHPVVFLYDVPKFAKTPPKKKNKNMWMEKWHLHDFYSYPGTTNNQMEKTRRTHFWSLQCQLFVKVRGNFSYFSEMWKTSEQWTAFFVAFTQFNVDFSQMFHNTIYKRIKVHSISIKVFLVLLLIAVV